MKPIKIKKKKPIIDKSIGQTIRFIRQLHSMNITNVSDKVGISRAYLSEIETGKKPCTIHYIEQLINFFGLSRKEYYFLNDIIRKNTPHDIILKMISEVK